MPDLVCALGGLAGVAWAFLVIRGRRRRRRNVLLVLWIGVCFIGLALNNAPLFAGLVIVPDVDLSPTEAVLAAGAMLVVLGGRVRDTATPSQKGVWRSAPWPGALGAVIALLATEIVLYAVRKRGVV